MSERDARTSDYRYFRWTQIGFVIFIIAYQLVVFERERVMGRGEIFPIASWSLFSKVPNLVNDYSVLIHEVDGLAVSPATVWEDSEAHFAAAVYHTAYIAIEQIGRAMEAGDADVAAELRGKFETLHMREAGNVRYDVVKRTYDPIERWRHGGYESISPIASYHKQTP